MKAGTTSLHHYLDAHPDIQMTTPKEVHYFSRNYGRDDEWYFKHFEDMDAEIVGESSPSYTRYPELPSVAERMQELLPDVKLIYILRDPLERIRSHYKHSILLGGKHENINRAVMDKWDEYVGPSKYYMQLSQYLEHYDLSDILILSSYSLRNSTTETVQKTYKFLGVDHGFSSDTFKDKLYKSDSRKKRSNFDRFILDTLNGRSWLKPKIPQWIFNKYQELFKGDKIQDVKCEFSEQVRDILREELAKDASQLRELTGQEFREWGI